MKQNRMKKGHVAVVALLGALGAASVMPVPANAVETQKQALKRSTNEIATLKQELAEQRALINKLLAVQSSQKATIDKIETRTAQAPAEVYAQTPTQTAGQTSVQTAAQTVNSLLPKGLSVYGRVDVNLANTNSGYGRKFTVGSGGMSASYLGLKGKEELGYGLSMVGLVEMGVDLSTGVVSNGPAGTIGDNNTVASSGGLAGTGNQIFSRQAYAGLASKTFGQVTLGRQYSGSYLALANEGTAFGPGYYNTSGIFLAAIGGMPTRVNNAIVYQTPSFEGFMKGFSVYATYTAGSENNNDSRGGPLNSANGNIVSSTRITDASGEGYDLALYYRLKALGWGWDGERKSTDGLTVAATAWTIKNASYDTSGGTNGLGPKETGLATKRGWQLLASYDFGVAKIYGNYVSGWYSGGNYANVTKTLSDADGWSFSAKVPFGKHTVLANYSILDDKSKDNRDASMLGIAYTYEIVKDTWLYVSWGQVFNDKHGTYSLKNGSDLVGVVAQPGYEPDGIMMGVDTKF